MSHCTWLHSVKFVAFYIMGLRRWRSFAFHFFLFVARLNIWFQQAPDESCGWDKTSCASQVGQSLSFALCTLGVSRHWIFQHWHHGQPYFIFYSSLQLHCCKMRIDVCKEAGSRTFLALYVALCCSDPLGLLTVFIHLRADLHHLLNLVT